MHSLRVQWSGPIDLFLSGHKGLAAARAVLASGPTGIRCAVIARDQGLVDDPADEIARVLGRAGIPTRENMPPNTGQVAALAIGWRRLIHADYEYVFVVHDSLLPHLRGWNPLVTALVSGDRSIGATLFLADGGMDTGPIISQALIPIEVPARYSKALDLVCDCISNLVVDLLAQLPSGDVVANPQIESDATYSLWRDEDDYLIDWNSDAERIQRHIFAVGHPYRGAKSFLAGEGVRILDAEVWSTDLSVSNRQPGKIFSVERGHPLVICGQGLILLTDVIDAHGTSLLPITKLRQRFSAQI